MDFLSNCVSVCLSILKYIIIPDGGISFFSSLIYIVFGFGIICLLSDILRGDI